MQSACEQRPKLAQTVFEHEILNFQQSLATNSVKMYHGTKSDLTKRFSAFCNPQLPFKECKSAIVIEMSPLIRANFSNVTNVACFLDLATLLYFYMQKISANFGRIDLVFDRYFQKSLKSETRTGRGSGS